MRRIVPHFAAVKDLYPCAAECDYDEFLIVGDQYMRRLSFIKPENCPFQVHCLKLLDHVIFGSRIDEIRRFDHPPAIHMSEL
jgi:hypothetical protein